MLIISSNIWTMHINIKQCNSIIVEVLYHSIPTCARYFFSLQQIWWLFCVLLWNVPELYVEICSFFFRSQFFRWEFSFKWYDLQQQYTIPWIYSKNPVFHRKNYFIENQIPLRYSWFCCVRLLNLDILDFECMCKSK